MIQKKNIKQMSTSGGEFRVAEIEGRGRALVAAQTLRAGQIILRDSPILLYSAFPLFPSSASSSPYNSYCDCCFRTLQTSSSSSSLRSVYPCPECSLHLFCSPKCLAAALSSSHSPWVCKSLRLLRDCPSIHQQPVECQVQVRFLIAAYNLAHVFPSHFKTLLSLQGLGSGLNSTDSITPSAQLLHSLISSLCTPPPPPSIPLPQEGWFSMDLSATLLAKDKLNAFGLMEPFSECQRSVRAYGIYPKAAFFNHDCLPNACRFDYVDTATSACNTDIIVRMIHDVPQGREICLSYFPVNENYPNRQRRLLEDYGFTCQCDRCKVEANWSDIDNDDPDVEQGDDVMDEDTDQHMGVASESDNSDGAQADSGFPHAYFFLRYMCSRNNCWGTLAPLPSTGDSSSNIMECNACGDLKNDDDVGGDGQDELSMDESAVA